MRILVTGSSGHLGEALIESLTFRYPDYEIVGIDLLPSKSTTHVGSITDRDFCRFVMFGVRTVFHTAGLHKPHILTHTRNQFVDINVTGTLILLEEAVTAGVHSFIFTSTTSVYGDALSPPLDEPAGWITEKTVPRPKNIYGVTKLCAENLCQEFTRNHGMLCTSLRVSRFFPNEDDSDAEKGIDYCDDNIKVNEFFYRRVEIQDVVEAHIAAFEKHSTHYRMFIISGTTPFLESDAMALRVNAGEVLFGRYPQLSLEFLRRGWKMFSSISRVYVNDLARKELSWCPQYSFSTFIKSMEDKNDFSWRSPLCLSVGIKGYHQASPKVTIKSK